MSTYSPNLRIELITTGTQAGTWGNTTNSNLSTVLEAAIAGSITVTTTGASQALTYLNGPTSTPADNQSVRAILIVDTSYGGSFAIYTPPVSKAYIIKNISSHTLTIYNSTVIGNTTAAGTGVSVPAGKTMSVWSDGTNFANQVDYLSGVVIDSATINSATLVTPALGTPASGNLSNCTNIPVAQATGTLAVANGGTGATTLTSKSVIIGNGTSAVNFVAPGANGNVLVSDGTSWTSSSAPPAGSVITTNFSITESGGLLVFKYGTTTIATLNSAGNFKAAGDVTGGSVA